MSVARIALLRAVATSTAQDAALGSAPLLGKLLSALRDAADPPPKSMLPLEPPAAAAAMRRALAGSSSSLSVPN